MSDSVEFRHLEYLVAIHEGKNFTKAAEKLFRSQPAVSQQIRALEDDIGFPIFVRGGRDGVSPTPAGELILGWAQDVLAQRREMFIIAKAIHNGEVPPLRLGFSPFVTADLMQSFRLTYERLFPRCEMQLSSGGFTNVIQKIGLGNLDCAILPMPIDAHIYDVFQIAQSPLVICLRADDILASRSEIDIHEAAPRIKVFRDPEAHPAAHSRLVEMFREHTVPMHLVNSAATPLEMQWMVKEKYGLALIDQLMPLDHGLVTRPIAGLKWTADTAFVSSRQSRHLALPFIYKSLRQNSLSDERKRPQMERVRPQQLQLMG